MGMKNNIFDRRRRSIYSTNNSTLPLVIQLQSEPRSRIKLFKLVNPTVSVYIIVLCPENASNDTVTGLNWIPGIDKMDTYRTPARFPVFEWVLYQEHTFTDKRQNTRNWRQNRFLPLRNDLFVIVPVGGYVPFIREIRRLSDMGLSSPRSPCGTLHSPTISQGVRNTFSRHRNLPPDSPRKVVIQTGSRTGFCKVSRLCHWY